MNSNKAQKINRFFFSVAVFCCQISLIGERTAHRSSGVPAQAHKGELIITATSLSSLPVFLLYVAGKGFA